MTEYVNCISCIEEVNDCKLLAITVTKLFPVPNPDEFHVQGYKWILFIADCQRCSKFQELIYLIFIFGDPCSHMGNSPQFLRKRRSWKISIKKNPNIIELKYVMYEIKNGKNKNSSSDWSYRLVLFLNTKSNTAAIAWTLFHSDDLPWNKYGLIYGIKEVFLFLLLQSYKDKKDAFRIWHKILISHRNTFIT